jgi:aryl-alcohol dehydrogenase-like predicted oxidoreductase
MSLTGYAATGSTENYKTRFAGRAAEGHFRQQQGLWLSSIGLGTYLGRWDAATDESYAQAIARAVELGCNVLDTAANYRFQRSERSLGEALKRLQAAGYGRGEVVVCTKGGYLPFDGEPPADARRYVEETFVRPGIAGFADFADGSHCMTPAYLSHQLGQSLQNMGLECVDVYYLHNPEAQLGAVSREEFDQRLRAAFLKLEECRAAGKLRFYGAATWNGFRAAPNAREYLSLARMRELAQEAGGENHGFRFAQLPFNFAMPEALLSNNQKLNGASGSLLEVAAELGVTVVASASLLQGRVAQNLSEDVRAPLGNLPTDAQTALQFARSTPGLTTALAGMSRVAHVEENLHLVGVAPAASEQYGQLFSNG